MNRKNKSIFVYLTKNAFFSCFFALCFIALETTAGNVNLAQGTTVVIEVVTPINSSKTKLNDTLTLRVKYDVKVNDQIVIPNGALAYAKVKNVIKPKNVGKPGSIEIEPLFTTSIDGQMILLSGTALNTEGKSKKNLSLILTGAGCFVLPGINFLALLIKGEDALVVSGATLETVTSNSYDININGNSSATAAKTASKEMPAMRGGSDPFKGTNVANANKEIKVGKYYALIIGIDTYTGTWSPLKNAVNDAKAIEILLQQQYRTDVVKTLYNTQATRTNIMTEFEWLVANVKENDNVFIYYSGHGDFKKELNKGYWVPADSKSNSVSQFVSNNDIQTFLSGINSKHTLLVSDACFSGDIFRGYTTSIPFDNTEKYYFNIYNVKSRQAISSGGIEPVMDGGKNGHSVFAYYLLQALKTNDAKYFDAGQLFNKIKIPVVNNSDQSPNFNPIKNSGDEGGQYIFIKK